MSPSKRRQEEVSEDLVQVLPEPVTEPGLGPEVGFVKRGKADFMTLIREAANYRELSKTPYGLKPIFVFAIIGVIQALDSQVLTVATPEIIKDLDIDILPLFGALSIISFFLIFFSIGLAYLADRIPRVPLFAGGVMLNGIASLFTTTATELRTFGVGRAADSVGEATQGVPSAPLIADYYPPESRGKVFALFGVTSRVIGLTAPVIVAGLVLIDEEGLFWRLPYLITGPLLILGALMSLFVLKEPIRGYMERKALGAPEDVARKPEEPASLGEAWRTVWAIRTLRRLFIGDIIGSPGSFIFSIFFGIFLLEKYSLGVGERAILSTLVGVVGLPFGFLAGGLLDVLLKRRPSRVLVFSGLLGVGGSFVVFLIASGPPLWAIYAAFMLYGALSSLLGPARGVLFANILPAHVRALGGSVRLLAAIPGTLARTALLGFLFTRYGNQGALFLAGFFFIVSALIDLSAAGLYERDVRAALASQLASAEWRRAKKEGRGKLLVCRDVDVEYEGGVQVLFGVDFDVDAGQLIALLGTNGAGKSTLLKAISGTQEASSGAIVFDGRDITHMPPHEVASRGVIHMPGGRGAFPDLSVEENLELGSWMLNYKEGNTRLEEVYAVFPILKERAKERAQTLSGGEQQMLSLAQAFLSKPRLLMIDELSLGLSPAVVQQLTEIVRRINANGTTVIVVEQSVNVALTLAEKAIFMEKGEVKFFGDTTDLLRRPDILRAVYVKGTGAFMDSSGSGVKTDREMRRFEIEQARPILEVQGVSKNFGGVIAVDDASLVLREGEALGLIGPNGAGKTTLFDLISGYQISDSGSIVYDGVDITNLSAQERSKKRLVRRFQDARLFPSLTVYENILVALDRRLEVRNIALTALQVPQVRQAERRIRRRAERLIELLELGSYRDKFVKELSTGLRRITDLACVLASEPKLLLLDEPSTGIAQAESEALAPLLRRVRFETGCSMLVIEHDMPLISAISDELVAMIEGRVVLQGPAEVVLNDETLIQAYLGTSEEAIQRSGVKPLSSSKT